jgi:hypothetical protein
LNNVRDPDIWQMTKARVAPVTGVAFGVLVEIAKAEIRERLGLP